SATTMTSTASHSAMARNTADTSSAAGRAVTARPTSLAPDQTGASEYDMPLTLPKASETAQLSPASEAASSLSVSRGSARRASSVMGQLHCQALEQVGPRPAALVEAVEPEELVGRVDGLVSHREAEDDRVHTQARLERLAHRHGASQPDHPGVGAVLRPQRADDGVQSR